MQNLFSLGSVYFQFRHGYLLKNPHARPFQAPQMEETNKKYNIKRIKNYFLPELLFLSFSSLFLKIHFTNKSV